MPAQLVTEQGPTSAPVFTLPAVGVVTLGRNTGNSLILLDSHVSRFHARISCRNGRFFLRDNGSVNGTRVDGRLIGCETPLCDGQLLRAGGVLLRFQVLSEKGGQPPRPVGVDPAWLMANDRAVLHVASTIAGENLSELLPVLADALEDAGCRDADLLEHCRTEAAHCQPCWVLNLIFSPTPPRAMTAGSHQRLDSGLWMDYPEQAQIIHPEPY